MPGQKRNKIEIINLNTTLTTKKKKKIKCFFPEIAPSPCDFTGGFCQTFKVIMSMLYK